MGYAIKTNFFLPLNFKLLLSFILMIFLIGCGDNSNSVSIYEDEGKQFAWNEKGMDAIRMKLKDGGSAQFRDVFFHKAYLNGKVIPLTCGYVNSKNSFGGYSGFQGFIAAGSTLSFLEEQMSDGEFEKTWSQLCQ